MESPSQWSIASLPVEVWRNIAERLWTFDIYRLRLSGDRRLLQTLENPTVVTHLSFQGRLPPKISSFKPRIPQILKRLSFEVISPPFIALVLSLLDSSTQSGFIDSIDLKYLVDSDNWLNSRSEFDSCDLLKCLTAFPALTHLYVHGPTDSNIYLEDSLPFSLPPHLTSLSCKVLRLDGAPLPPLTSLRVKTMDLLAPAALSKLPRTITDLKSMCTLRHPTIKDFSEFCRFGDILLPLEEMRPLLDEESLPSGQIEAIIAGLAPKLATRKDREAVEMKMREALRRFHETRLEGFGALRQLPSLKRLDVHCNGCSEQDYIRLPPQLQALKARSHEWDEFLLEPRTCLYPPLLTTLQDNAYSVLAYDDEQQHMPLDESAEDRDFVGSLPSTISESPYLAYINKLPPNLTSLRLKDIDCSTDPEPSLLSSALSLLPNRITDLLLPSTGVIPAIHFPLLPPQLTSFTWLGSLECAELALLPHSIKTLWLSELYAAKLLEQVEPGSSKDTISHPPWPRSLTSVVADRTPFTTRTLQQLQPSICEFVFADVIIDDYFFSLLSDAEKTDLKTIDPTTLSALARRHFRLWGPRHVYNLALELTSDFLQHLAPMSTSLELSQYTAMPHDRSFENFSHLKQLLVRRRWDVNGGSFVDHQHRHDFINEQTMTAKRSNSHFTDHLFQHLPESLNKLTLTSAVLCQFTARVLWSLPPHLMQLQLPQVFAIPTAVSSFWPPELDTLNESTVKRVVDEQIFALRDRLIQNPVVIVRFLPKLSNIETYDRNDEVHQFNFPEHITDISLTESHDVPEFCDHLPPRLQKFELNLESALMDSDLTKLPRTLVQLILHLNTMLTDACMPLLPPQLEVLHLPENPNFTNAAIALLPRGLRSLDLQSAHKLDDDCSAQLPRTLELLNLAAAHFTGVHFAHLPSSLTLLDLSGSQELFKADPSTLPKSLTELRAPDAFMAKCAGVLPLLVLSQVDTGAQSNVDDLWDPLDPFG